MPDANQPNPSLGDGGAAVQARLPGPSPAVLRAIPDQVVLDPKAAAATRYRWRVLLVLAGLVLAFGLYWGSSYVFAYTDDAYVTSDLVGVAPQITGRIIAVPIVDNQTVAKGTLLAEIDPTPFRLELAKQVAKRSEAEAQLAVDHDLVKSAKAARDEAAAKARLASDNLQRDQPIAAAGFLSRQALDTATATAQEADAALASAETAVAKQRQMEALHEATIKSITAEIAYLQWQLDQTKVLAPTDGTITNLILRIGDQAVANQPLLGLVDALPGVSTRITGKRDPPHAGLASLCLGVAQYLSLAYSSGIHSRHSARHRSPTDAQHFVALCGADNRLDPL